MKDYEAARRCEVCHQENGRHWTVPHVDQSPVIARRRAEVLVEGAFNEADECACVEGIMSIVADAVAQAVQEERERVAHIKRFATYMSKTLRRAPAGDA